MGPGQTSIFRGSIGNTFLFRFKKFQCFFKLSIFDGIFDFRGDDSGESPLLQSQPVQLLKRNDDRVIGLQPFAFNKFSGGCDKFDLTVGENVDVVNRVYMEITSMNLCYPVMVPITLIG